jgi:hypothetical protein
MDMQRLFERIADHHDGTVEAEEVREDYLRIVFHIHHGESRERVEVFPYECLSKDGATVHLVRVGHPDDGEPVLVSPIPSAIIAVALR